MMHDDYRAPLHLRRPPIYQPPPLDYDLPAPPPRDRLSPWLVFSCWCLAALFAGACLAWGLR